VWCVLTDIIKKELEPKYSILPVLGVGLVMSQGKACTRISYILTHKALDVLSALCIVTSIWVLQNQGILTGRMNILFICNKSVTTQNL
jgi:hypothetical protein